MTKPTIADKKPMIIEAEPGTYFWCACGLSQKQPHCDGSHKNTGITPLKYEVTETKKIALCMCKQTAKPPFCDGAHTKL